MIYQKGTHFAQVWEEKYLSGMGVYLDCVPYERLRDGDKFYLVREEENVTGEVARFVEMIVRTKPDALCHGGLCAVNPATRTDLKDIDYDS